MSCVAVASWCPGPLEILVMAVVGVMVLVTVAFMIFLNWRIFSKAGYSGALGLLVLVPFGQFILLCILAFGRWPTLRDLENLKRLQGPPRPKRRPGQRPG